MEAEVVRWGAPRLGVGVLPGPCGTSVSSPNLASCLRLQLSPPVPQLQLIYHASWALLSLRLRHHRRTRRERARFTFIFSCFCPGEGVARHASTRRQARWEEP